METSFISLSIVLPFVFLCSQASKFKLCFEYRMCVKGKYLLFQQNSLCCLCTLIAIKETIHGLTWDSKSSALKNEVAFSVSAYKTKLR